MKNLACRIVFLSAVSLSTVLGARAGGPTQDTIPWSYEAPPPNALRGEDPCAFVERAADGTFGIEGEPRRHVDVDEPRASWVGGTAFGDGLVCASGTTIPLAIQSAPTGSASFPSGTDPDVGTAGWVPVGGAVRSYQTWYRDSVAFCTASTFNLTNAVRVTWLP